MKPIFNITDKNIVDKEDLPECHDFNELKLREHGLVINREMKTIKEWLEELPEPYRSQALRNTQTEILLLNESSLKSALMCAFKWNKTKEGAKYWNNLHENL